MTVKKQRRDIPRSPQDRHKFKMNRINLSRVLNAIATGQTRKVALGLIGSTTTTWSDWQKRGNAAIARQPEGFREEAELIIQDGTIDPKRPFHPQNPYWDNGIEHFHMDEVEWGYVLSVLLTPKADALAEGYAVQQIRHAGRKDWKANAWWLERTRPDTYSRRSVVVHEGAEDAPVRMEVTGQSQDIMEKVLRLAGLEQDGEDSPEEGEDADA